MKKIYYLIMFLLLFAISCKIDNVSLVANASLGTVETSFAATTSTKSISNQTEEIEGMYFGELEVVAYQYTPGYVDTSGFGCNATSDWAYYVILQSGHYAARDNLLLNGQIIDIDEMNSEYKFKFDSKYLDAFDNFCLDFIEVNVYRTGIVIGKKYFGMNAEHNGLDEHPLHKYQTMFNYPDYWRNTNVDGFLVYDQSFSVIFARSDWFPEPVLVRLENYSNHTFTYTWSNKELSIDQKSKLESMATNGTARRFYGNLIIIPYDGPVRIALKDNAVGMKKPNITINFDYSELLTDTTYNDFADNSFVDGNAIIYRIKNNIPFGLNVTILDEN